MAVSTAKNAEKNNERHMLEGSNDKSQWLNPSKQLVDQAVDRWRACKLRADNTSVVVVMLDPPGPPRAQVLRKQRDAARGVVPPTKKACDNTNAPPLPPKPQPKHPAKGLAIISRFPNSSKPEEAAGKNLVAIKDEDVKVNENSSQRIVHDSSKTEPTKVNVVKPQREEDNVAPAVVASPEGSKLAVAPGKTDKTDSDIQVNEVSSSDSESPSKAAPRPAPRKSLSRELASLALDSPAPKLPARGRRSSGRLANTRSGVLAPRRRGRSIDGAATGRANESDEENGGGAGRKLQNPIVQSHKSGVVTQGPSSKLEEVEAKCDALSTKLRMMERKVADKTSQLSQEVKDIKSKLDVSTPTRVLRSRNGEVQTPASGTKRKRGENKEDEKEVRGQKRERTTTWSSLVGAKLDKQQQKNGRVTRKSTGALALPGRSRRSLNILKK